MRIRRIAIRVRSLRAFCRCSALCRTVLLYAFRKLGSVSLVCVKSLACFVKLLLSSIYLCLRSCWILQQILSFIKSLTIITGSLTRSSILSRIRITISTQILMNRSILIRRGLLGCIILVNGLNQVISLSRKLVQVSSCSVKIFKKLCHIPIQRLTLSMRLQILKRIFVGHVNILIWNNRLWDFCITLLIPRKLVVKSIMKLLKCLFISFLSFLSI